MSKAFSNYEKELLQKRILEQSFKLFSIYGLKKTNIEEIAESTGISKGAFYSFYCSKEALFMEVIEQAEKRARQEILAAIDLPGTSNRERLLTVLKKAYSLFREIPILQFITGGDYDLLFRRVPAEKLQQHLENDRAFIDELITHCQEAGIPIQVPPEQLIMLLYPMALTIIHEDELQKMGFTGNIDLFLELVAAYCLGEIQTELQAEG
jgi:AcrR family transcriptional regulator